ncbi:hypothetical protein B0H16DRAFT_1535108 [Mycena metata]|uniref:Uncharacterized protein n=1 Tax=Mycena metata TaxID=1033252 RepID=A0AAD7J9U8_9AGAR|nr:hypothetical protein B0H16DRAFT_1535108 [Mycena metata]
MILPQEKDDNSAVSPSTPTYGPASGGPYANGDFAPSFSSPPSSISGPSSSLRPPPLEWASSSSTDGSGPLFPPVTHSQTHLPVKPAEAPSLTRLPPANIPRVPFQPMFLLADGASLRDGFPTVPPPSMQQPHPFALRDVKETDWLQFLTDLRVVANLTPQDRVAASSVPVLSAIPLVNIAVAAAITQHFQRKKKWLASLLVDKWNHHFFHRRRIEVILMRGQSKLSGQSGQPVANLYTPQTVNFNPPPLTIADTKTAPSADKTYRLFVVSMDA